MELHTLKVLAKSGSIGGFITGALIHVLGTWDGWIFQTTLSVESVKVVGGFLRDALIAGGMGAALGVVVILFTFLAVSVTHMSRNRLYYSWPIAMMCAAVIASILLSGMQADLLAQMRIAGSVIVGVTTSIWLLTPLLSAAPYAIPSPKGRYQAHR